MPPGRRTASPSPLLAALLSALLPGAGQVYARRWRRGLWLIGITLALATPALVIVLLLFGPWEVSRIGLAVDLIRPFFRNPALVLALFAAVVGLLAFRVFAVLDAFLVARRPGWRGVGPVAAAAAVALLLAAVAWPHGWAGVQALALHDFVTTDFLTDPGQAATTTAVPATTSTTLPATPTSSPATTSTSSTTTAPTTTTEPDPFAGEDRITVALLGGDAGPGRWGIRTDTIIVVSVEPATGHTAMFSIPRNQAQWPIPEGIPAYFVDDCHCYREITNTIYAYGLDHPDLFPGGANSGGNAVKAILGHGLGLEIDYFALVDMLGFIQLADALGGIDIDVSKPVYDPGHHHPDGTITDVSIPVGQHHLDGKTALAYVRARRQDDDYHRMDRQRCVLEAVADRADPFTLLRRLADILPIASENLRTDIPVERFPDLIELLEKVDTGRIVTVRFMPYAPELAGTGTSYVAGTDEKRYSIPNLDLIRATVQIALEREPDEALASLNLASLEEVCRVG